MIVLGSWLVGNVLRETASVDEAVSRRYSQRNYQRIIEANYKLKEENLEFRETLEKISATRFESSEIKYLELPDEAENILRKYS